MVIVILFSSIVSEGNQNQRAQISVKQPLLIHHSEMIVQFYLPVLLSIKINLKGFPGSRRLEVLNCVG